MGKVYNMWEKNFDGKQMSLFPKDELDDVVEDMLINDDSDEVVVRTSKRKKRSKSKYKHCGTCEQNITLLKKRDSLNHKNTYHREMAKDYCKNHETSYSYHKCKPHWCGDCGFLIKYIVDIDHKKWD